MNKIIGFIGCGNMGGAIAEAVSKASTGTEVWLSDPCAKKVNELSSKIGAKPSDNQEISKNADIIFLAVKPQVIGDVINEIKDTISDSVLIVSMAAGVSMSKIEGFFERNISLIRIMPNTPVSVGEGMILYDTNSLVSSELEEFFTTVMSKAGKLDKIAEKLIDAASALSGCGPAFVYMFIEALADGGVACGLPRDKALAYATQTLLGSSKLLAETNKHPGELKDAVCSPGGSTIMGVKALENGSLRGTVINAVSEAFAKTKELGK
ncbi:MAG: pyrroline-5-carboxylate reductase [Ruminococcaceae bacterium]|nr:pyrroline-5-carboxylate reductase [Oscillospiraceae bacterium]